MENEKVDKISTPGERAENFEKKVKLPTPAERALAAKL